MDGNILPIVVLALTTLIFVGLFFRTNTKNRELERENARLMGETKDQGGLIENIANRVFTLQNEKSRSEIERTLAPLKQNIEGFRNRLEDISKDQESGRAELKQHIVNLLETNREVEEMAQGLARALKSDKKMQGNWGEMILESVLEHSGLVKDREYKLQPSFGSEEGGVLRPDAVVFLPDNKQIIVDAKVSLNAYVSYNEAEDETERAVCLKQHLAAVKKHVDSLSDKDYSRLSGLNSLEYVLLFFAVEPAFILAQQEDNTLFSYALRKRIIPVAPSTLLATLRVIHNIWRNEKRNKKCRRDRPPSGCDV